LKEGSLQGSVSQFSVEKKSSNSQGYEDRRKLKGRYDYDYDGLNESQNHKQYFVNLDEQENLTNSEHRASAKLPEGAAPDLQDSPL